MAGDKRGSIAFFATYRTPVPLHLFSCPKLTPKDNEVRMIDDIDDSYNYNGQEIPPAALKTLLKRPKLASYGNEADVDSGRLSGLVFVSERSDLELLHIALRFNYVNAPKVKVFSLAEVFGKDDFKGVRMEDSACFAHDHLIYVSTKDPATERRQPWTAVYKTNLKTGKTYRLTPREHADLSPSVSPSGKKIAVASFEGKKGGWEGEIEDLRTNIYVMNVEEPYNRTKVVENGGWPTWGSDDVIFFHRKDDPIPRKNNDKHPKDEFWGVYRADIGKGLTSVTPRMTPANIDGFTPAALDANTVVVVTVRQESGLGAAREEAQFRHIEIFDTARGPNGSTTITQNTRSKADHFNPFVMDGGKRIGYHRGWSEKLEFDKAVKRPFQKLDCPLNDVSLFRVSGVFPTVSKDGTKLAFVDNEFKAVWVADKQGLHIAYEEEGADRVFSPVWDQCEDTLYVCVGPSFNAKEQVNIIAITKVSNYRRQSHPLTDSYNNAFPSSSPDGKRLVFRSTRNGGYKNLYIMENKKEGVCDGVEPTRLTEGKWTDTHCQWSPNGNWIVFSSTRSKPESGVPETDNGLDPGYFGVFLVNPDDPDVWIRVMISGSDISGHVNHPFFSPDGLSIVVTSDLAAVTVDPISLPLFEHSVRSYGDIFTIDIDTIDIDPNHPIDKQRIKDVKKFTRITHSRYENSTATWTRFSTEDPNASWKMFLKKESDFIPACPYAHPDGGESWHMTGHLILPRRCC
ncbi:uncharacterized protein LOC126793131 [Argentina anserina]|uniref:uncharacterized protein LOC126793131 n=1 Tax=Argentina anserina TaxID=57926 RepID=UPI002176868C|nr:uncharacterized protein LOC126793131 [Potentilla anserina]